MNVSLTSKLEEFVRHKVASGLYNNTSEVLREALRLMIHRDSLAVAIRHTGLPQKHAVHAQLAALEGPLREKGITSLALFGSVVRGDAGPDSDIDVLVDIAPEAHFSLVNLVSVKNLLEEFLGREVDVVTREGVEPSIRGRVFSEAEHVF
jgi:uncharacterized protein